MREDIKGNGIAIGIVFVLIMVSVICGMIALWQMM